MKKHKIYFFILIIFIVQCSKNEYSKYYKNYETFNKLPTVIKKNIHPFSKNKYQLYISELNIIDNRYLLIVNAEKETAIQIYDIETKEIIKQFGKKGRGPGEYLAISSILIDSNNKYKIWIFDANQAKFDLINLKSVLLSNKSLPDTTMKPSMDAGLPLLWCNLNNDTFLATGGLIKRLCIYNNKLDTIKTGGFIPGKINEERDIYRYLMPTNIIKNNSKKIIVVGNMRTDVLEFYDYNLNNIKTIHGPDILKPCFLKKDKCLSNGYTRLCANGKNIYCVYSGENTEKVKNWLVSFGKQILVFDWDGNPIMKIKTDYRMGTIDITEDGKTLYVGYFDGEYFRIGYIDISDIEEK